MIDTSPFEYCECQPMGNQYTVCHSALSLEEQGKKVTLSTRTNEEAKKVAALVELKGAGGIPHAFEQLAYTRKHRLEYQDLRDQLDIRPQAV